MCLSSAPSAPAPSTAPPQYMHNTYLDSAGSGNPQFSGSQNELAAGFSRSSANASALSGGVTAGTNNPGGQGLVTPANGGPRTPGLVVPKLPGASVVNPVMGGNMAGALPTTGVRVAAK